MRRPGVRGAQFSAAVLAPLLLSGCTGQGPSGPPELTDASRLHLAEVATQSGATGFALAMYQQAAEKAPRSVAAQAGYAQALIRAGQLSEAQAVLDRALRNCGPDPDLSMQRGRLELAEGEASQALLDFTAVLGARPLDARALNNEGIALDMLGRHADAQADYRKVLAARPGSESASDNLAVSLMLEGKFPEAVTVLAPVADQPGSSARTRANMAVALAAAGGRSGTRAPTDLGSEVMAMAQALERRPH